MEFWKRFYNQPILWALAVLMTIITGVIIQNTPKLVKVSALQSTADYTDPTVQIDEGVVKNALLHSLFIEGLDFQTPTILGDIPVSYQYNTVAGVLLLAALFAMVILITRRTHSGLFILGPLLVITFISILVLSNVLKEESATTGVKPIVDFGDMLFNWLFIYGGVGLGVFLGMRYLIRQGLISGVDGDGPLDFSRLQQAAVTTAGTLGQTANAVGNQISRSIGDMQPIVSQFKIKRCIYCGCDIKGGKCTICRCPATTADYIIDIAYGACEECKAPKAFHARYCYHCGQLFVKDGGPDLPDDHKVAYQHCKNCGGRCNLEDRFCGNCGFNLVSTLVSHN